MSCSVRVEANSPHSPVALRDFAQELRTPMSGIGPALGASMTIARSQEALRRARFGSAVVANKIVSLDPPHAPRTLHGRQPIPASGPRTSLIDAEWETQADEARDSSPVAEHTATLPPPAFVADGPSVLPTWPPANDQQPPAASTDDAKARAGWRVLAVLALAALSLCLGVGLLRSELTFAQAAPSRLEEVRTAPSPAPTISELAIAAPAPPMPSASATPTAEAPARPKKSKAPTAHLNRPAHTARSAPTRRSAAATDNPY